MSESGAHQGAAVTGVGAVTVAGAGISKLAEALRTGRPLLQPARGGQWLGALVDDRVLDLGNLVPARRRRRLGRGARMMLLACHQAAAQTPTIAADELGLVCGTGIGSLRETVEFLVQMEEEGARAASPSLFPSSVMSAVAGQVSIELGACGFGATVSQGEVSGDLAVMVAAQALSLGRASAIIAGGVDEAPQLTFAALSRLGVLGHQAPRPYGAGSAGIALAEGAAALMIEPVEQVRRRGGRPLALLEGYAAGGGDRDAADVVGRCLDDAGVDPGHVDLVIGSACGRIARDAREAAMLADVFSGVAGRPHLTTPHGAAGTFMADGALRIALAVAMLAGEGTFAPAGVPADLPLPLPRATCGAPRPVRRVLVVGQADDLPYTGGDDRSDGDEGDRGRGAQLVTAVLLRAAAEA